jgi:hypothetical protein
MKNKKNMAQVKRIKAKKNKGALGSGTLFVVILILIVSALAFTLIGGQLPQLDSNQTGAPVSIITKPPEDAKTNLQLYTFSGATLAPSLPPTAATGCSASNYDDEPEILVGSDPAPGGATSGKIRVWVTDERSPYIAPNETVDPNTGVPTPGDRAAIDSNGNFLWEPTLYLASATGVPPAKPFCDAKTANCTPYFPVTIKGDYSPALANSGTKLKGPTIDPDWTNFVNGPEYINYPGKQRSIGLLGYMSEYIWDPATLNIAKGNYWAQFVIHDGDREIGVSCVTLQIQ